MFLRARDEYRGGGHLGHDHNDMFDDISDAGYLGYEFPSRVRLFLPIYTNRRRIHDILAEQDPTRRMGTFRDLSRFPSSHVLLDIRKEQEEPVRRREEDELNRDRPNAIDNKLVSTTRVLLLLYRSCQWDPTHCPTLHSAHKFRSGDHGDYHGENTTDQIRAPRGAVGGGETRTRRGLSVPGSVWLQRFTGDGRGRFYCSSSGETL